MVGLCDFQPLNLRTMDTKSNQYGQLITVGGVDGVYGDFSQTPMHVPTQVIAVVDIGGISKHGESSHWSNNLSTAYKHVTS